MSGVPSGRRPGRVQDKIPKIARQKITLRGVQPVNETAHAIKGGRELDRNVLQGKFSQIFNWQNCLMLKDVRGKKVFNKNRCGSDRSSFRHEAFFSFAQHNIKCRDQLTTDHGKEHDDRR